MRRCLPIDPPPGKLHVALCIGVAVAAGVSGLALNAAHVSHLENLWLGRALTLPVAVALGPLFGVVAAAVGALSILDADPWLAVLFVAEALLLGVATRRHHTSMAARTLLFTLLALSVAVFPEIHGLPALALTTVPLSIQRVLVLIVAPVASDFLSVGLARLTIRLGLASASPPRPPLRDQILHASILVAALPLLVVNVISGEIISSRHQEEVTARLTDTALTLSDRFSSYLEGNVAGVQALAASIRGNDAGRADEILREFAVTFPAFRSMGTTDATGVVVNRVSDVPTPKGLSLGNRAFFHETIASRRTTISDVTWSALRGDSIVFIGVPIVARGGQVAGVAYGLLDLDAFADFVRPYLDSPNSAVVLLDRSNRVIFTSQDAGYRRGEDLTNSPMVHGADDTPLGSSGSKAAGASGVYPYHQTSTPGGQGHSSDTVQLASRGVVPGTGWTVYVQQPQSLLAAEMPAYFMVTMGFLLLAIGGSMVAARQFAAAVTTPLEGLVGVVSRISVESVDAITVPANAPMEVSALADGVSRMQDRLRDSYRQLQQARDEGEWANQKLETLTATLEATVAKRTADLANTTQFLENVLTALPGALFVADQQGTVLLCNDTAAVLTGRPVVDITGLPLSAVLDTRSAAESPAVRTEQNLITAGGDRIPVLVSVATLKNPDHTGSAGAIHIALDVRDRKRLELELQHAQKLESVGRLAAGVAHEINTPAQFVSDSVQFLKEGLTDLFALVGKYRSLHAAVLRGAVTTDLAADVVQAERDADLDYLIQNVPGAIERSIDGLSRVTTIVKSMKEFAHPDRKEMTLVDLNQGIQSTLVIARNEYKYVADVETDLGLLPPVRCHAGDINQVVLNVVINAAHAIADVVGDGEGRGRIVVQTRHEGDSVVIRITDTGGGIPEGIRQRVFDPFFTTKGVGKGTGQGLAIGRAIIDRHEGQFVFDTVVGQGTTFTVRLPIDGPRAASEAAA
ncbi:MAG: ATP-binding protein [Vicinamibacterales bacterium]